MTGIQEDGNERRYIRKYKMCIRSEERKRAEMVIIWSTKRLNQVGIWNKSKNAQIFETEKDLFC